MEKEQPPAYTEAGGSMAQGSVCVVPARFNGYFSWANPKKYYLGPDKENTQFLVRCPDSIRKNNVIIYAGPDTKAGVLTEYKMDRFGRNKPFTVNSPQYGDMELNYGTSRGVFKEKTLYFTTNTGERFEWRNTRGREIKELHGRFSYGWKLVRLSTRNSELGGKRNERENGYTSDGEEVVALVGFNVTRLSSHIFTFLFINSGVTGAFGPLWEVVTLASAFNLVYAEIVKTAAAASSAGGS